MNNKTKNIFVTILLTVFFISSSILCLIKKPDDISLSERRKLAQLPNITWEGIFGGDNIDDFEDYTLDQFPFRELLRSVKAIFQFGVFLQKDNNGIYIVDNSVFKIEYPMRERSVENAAEKLNSLYETYMKDKNINAYYSIIPDKSYFTAAANGYPSLDYKKLVKIMNDGVEDMTYIDIFPCLDISDYYATDTHWSQDKLGEVVKKISSEMGFYELLSGEYTAKKFSPFYGVYYGQSALSMPADTLYYLTNDVIESCIVQNLETGKTTKVYDLEKLGGMDPYDVFLSGAAAFLTVENPNANNDKELIVFRDSFGSSLTPLFLEAYSKVTIVDIRYVHSSLLGKLIDFGGQDVLFIYSAPVINNSTMLR